MRPTLALRALPRRNPRPGSFKEHFRQQPFFWLGAGISISYWIIPQTRDFLLWFVEPGMREAVRITSGKSSAMGSLKDQHAQAKKEGVAWGYLGQYPVPTLSLLLWPLGWGSKE